jgi:Right handed beta helix region
MNPKPRLITGSALAFAMIVTCGTAFGKHHAAVFRVLPNGTNDTANLQAAFDAAVQAGPGSTVQLVKGTYHTGQIVVNNFQGTFVGAGADKTALTNLPNLYVTPDGGWLNPPSADNPWPSLLTFVGGDFQVSDLGVRITGSTATTGWSNLGMFDPPIRAMCFGFLLAGPPKTNATFSRVSIEGERDPSETVYGYNLWNGVFFDGCIGVLPFPPVSGSFVVRDSVFRHLGSGTPICNVSDASILITRNRFEDMFLGMDGGGLLHSRYEFSFNTVEGLFGIDLYDVGYWAEADSSQVTSSKLLIRNNIFKGLYGVYLDTTFAGENECLVVSNNFRDVTNAGVYLGPATSDCVVKHNTPTTIVDLGTDNVIENGRHQCK